MRRFLCTAQGEDHRVHIVAAGDLTQLPHVFEKFVFGAPQLSVDHNDKFEPESKSSRVTDSQHRPDYRISFVENF